MILGQKGVVAGLAEEAIATCIPDQTVVAALRGAAFDHVGLRRADQPVVAIPAADVLALQTVSPRTIGLLGPVDPQVDRERVWNVRVITGVLAGLADDDVVTEVWEETVGATAANQPVITLGAGTAGVPNEKPPPITGSKDIIAPLSP